MSQWNIYPPQQEINKSEISILNIFFIYLICFIFVVLIRVSTWPDGKHVDSVFYSQVVLVPLLLGSAISAYYAMFASAIDFYRESKVEISKWRLYHMKKYARKHLTIAGWSSITPINNIALQMLKLEGEYPLSPKTPLRIETEEDFNVTRLQKIFTRLIEPLSERLSKYSDVGVTLWVHDAPETAVDDLQIVLQQQKIKFNDKITCLSECPDYSLLNTMITESERYWKYNQLLIIADLYSDDDIKCMENVSAFFICKEFPTHEKPRPVYLFQPMVDNLELTESVPVFLAAEQTAVPKTLWYTGLSKAEKYPLFSALGENKVAPDRLELELSFVERTAGYRWLALAIASDAVMYAQGPQLVAASEKNKPCLTVLSHALPSVVPEPDINKFLPPFFYAAIATVLGVFSAAVAWGVFIGKFNFWWGIFIAFAIVVITMVIGFTLTNSASNQAWEDIAGS